MLESGTIRPSQSAWCNAMVLVRKKVGSLWFCINFCHLNTHRKRDSYPLLRIQEALESLVGAGHFSCLDLKSGFWQIKIEEEALKQNTAFTATWGFSKVELPGLCKFNLIYCLIYLDDLIVFLQTAEELHRLHVVFN